MGAFTLFIIFCNILGNIFSYSAFSISVDFFRVSIFHIVLFSLHIYQTAVFLNCPQLNDNKKDLKYPTSL